MPDAGKTNVLYVLMNGEPNEWALRKNVEPGSVTSGVALIRFTDVPDEVVAELEDGAEPSQLWDELENCPTEMLQ